MADTLTDILYPVVEEAKGSIEAAAGLETKPDTVLFGEGGLDSMGLVQFIVLVEERIEDETGVEVRLATDKAMSQRSSPFATLGALATFIDACLAEERAE